MTVQAYGGKTAEELKEEQEILLTVALQRASDAKLDPETLDKLVAIIADQPVRPWCEQRSARARYFSQITNEHGRRAAKRQLKLLKAMEREHPKLHEEILRERGSTCRADGDQDCTGDDRTSPVYFHARACRALREHVQWLESKGIPGRSPFISLQIPQCYLDRKSVGGVIAFLEHEAQFEHKQIALLVCLREKLGVDPYKAGNLPVDEDALELAHGMIRTQYSRFMKRQEKISSAAEEPTTGSSG